MDEHAYTDLEEIVSLKIEDLVVEGLDERLELVEAIGGGCCCCCCCCC